MAPWTPAICLDVLSTEPPQHPHSLPPFKWPPTHPHGSAKDHIFRICRAPPSSKPSHLKKGFMHITLPSSLGPSHFHVRMLIKNCRAAWLGTRIILRQVSPESEKIFDLIIQLYHSCGGRWQALSEELKIPADEMTKFLDYAATFLGNTGNFYVSRNICPRASRF